MPTYRRPNLSQQGTPVPRRNLIHYTQSFQRVAWGYVVPRVNRFIKERGLTQKAFATHIGIDPGQMNRLIGEPQNWTLETIAKLLIGAEHDPRKMVADLEEEVSAASSVSSGRAKRARTAHRRRDP
jgi:plasmid maintenance system antidote protein VapI